MGHQWVGALANFNFNIEYLTGCNNSAAGVLSRMAQHIEDDEVKCLLDGITIRTPDRAEFHKPLSQQAEIEDGVHVNAVRPSNTGPKGEINIVDWTKA